MNRETHTESFKLLDRAIAVGPAPVNDLVRQGLVRRRRHRIRTRAAGLVAASAMTGIVAVAVQSVPWQEDARQAAPADDRENPVPWAGLKPGGPLVPATTAPLEGHAVEVVVETAGDAVPGGFYDFVVRLKNNGNADVNLAPCPTFRMQYLGVVELGTLNCAAAPKAIEPGEAVAFDMRIPIRDLGVGGAYELVWQLGAEGAEGAEGSAMVELR